MLADDLVVAEELVQPLHRATPRTVPAAAPLSPTRHADEPCAGARTPHTFYDQHPSHGPEYLRSWCYGAKRSRLQPITDFVTLVERHWDGIITWHATRVSNGLLEGTNSLIQAAKARARGYRTKNKMITIAYLIAGKLLLPTVTNTRPA